MKSLGKVILKIVETKHVKNVKELIRLVREQVDANLEDITGEIKDLQ